MELGAKGSQKTKVQTAQDMLSQENTWAGKARTASARLKGQISCPLSSNNCQLLESSNYEKQKRVQGTDQSW